MPLREARPGDAAGIASVHVASWLGTYRGLMPDSLLDSLSVERRTRGWEQALAAQGDGVALVAEGRDGIVGFAHFGPARDDDAAGTAEIFALYVHPDHWDRGYGRDLMMAALGHLRAQGYGRAMLWVLDTNQRGRSFYQRGGWVTDGAEKVVESFGEPLNEVRYVIDLSG